MVSLKEFNDLEKNGYAGLAAIVKGDFSVLVFSFVRII
jgi:hypothetical protein